MGVGGGGGPKSLSNPKQISSTKYENINRKIGGQIQGGHQSVYHLSFLENHSHRTYSPWYSVEKHLTVGRNMHPNSIVGFKFVSRFVPNYSSRAKQQFHQTSVKGCKSFSK